MFLNKHTLLKPFPIIFTIVSPMQNRGRHHPVAAGVRRCCPPGELPAVRPPGGTAMMEAVDQQTPARFFFETKWVAPAKPLFSGLLQYNENEFPVVGPIFAGKSTLTVNQFRWNHLKTGSFGHVQIGFGAAQVDFVLGSKGWWTFGDANSHGFVSWRIGLEEKVPGRCDV